MGDEVQDWVRQSELASRLSLSTSSFAKLREAERIYVDKTALIYTLACRQEKFFLTRPRRFGKSLLVSTLASLFGEGLKDFAGLAIESLCTQAGYLTIKKFQGGNFHLGYPNEEVATSIATLYSDSFWTAGFLTILVRAA